MTGGSLIADKARVDTVSWWFGFRLIEPAGHQAVGTGPFASYDEAMRARDHAKSAPGYEVTIAFQAQSRDEADGEAQRLFLN